MTSSPAELLRDEGHPIGEIFLTREEIGARVVELGATLAAEYNGLEPLLVAPLKSSIVFLADLSRAMTITHGFDTVELAAFGGGSGGVRLTKDLDRPIAGRHVIVVEDVVDTGLTLSFLMRTFAERDPASLAAVSLLDRPYRRLVEDLPLTHVGFTAPDELFAGYGLGLDEHWRSLPDLHVIDAAELARVTGTGLAA
jgi:hypoxanthine phosphoribosyltransferase